MGRWREKNIKKTQTIDMHVGSVLHFDYSGEHNWDDWNKVNKQNPKKKNGKSASK